MSRKRVQWTLLAATVATPLAWAIACNAAVAVPLTAEPPPLPSPNTSPTGVASTTAMPAQQADVRDAGPDPEDMRKCAAPSVLLGLPPREGVVFNNAMTSADAGYIDRAQGVIDVLLGAEHDLRCCIDSWAAEHPSVRAKLVLIVTLAADGTPTRAAVDEARSSSMATAVGQCLAGAAMAATYPPSPTGVATTVEFPIRVEARGG